MTESKSVESKLKNFSINPSAAWCFVFFPALWYYGWTRLHSLGLFSASSYGTAMETSIVGIRDCQKLKDASVVYYNHRQCEASSSSVPLKYPLYLVRDDFRDAVATTWKHDEELGRGFLLISTSYGTGKIWQWETGGGPIPIGKTLHMIHSGCRSNNFLNCTDSDVAVGSGGIIVDTLHEPPRLIVAEWGEGRVVRLEANGARTPLIIQVPVDKPVVAEIEDTKDNETATTTETEEDPATDTEIIEGDDSPSTRRIEREVEEDPVTTTETIEKDSPPSTHHSERAIEEEPVTAAEIIEEDSSPSTHHSERAIEEDSVTTTEIVEPEIVEQDPSPLTHHSERAIEEDSVAATKVIEQDAFRSTHHSEREIEEDPVTTREIIVEQEDPSPSTRRLECPSKLLLTPFADLLVLDSSEGEDFLWQLPQIHKIPGLESLSASRKAHAWDHLMYNSSHQGITIGSTASTSSNTPNESVMPQKLLQSSHLGGMALVPKNWLQLYVTMKQGDSVVVVTLSLEDEDEDNDDDVVVTKETEAKSERQSSIYLDYSQYASKPGPIEVDEKGNLYVVVDDGILIVSSTRAILGKISIPAGLSIVDMTLGEDRFLYLATETKLYRLRLRNKNLSVPTDIVKQK